MSRNDRTKAYSNPVSDSHMDGEANAANLKQWSERASANSKTAPRAKGGAIKLPSTGGDVTLPDTGGKPKFED